MEKIEILDSNYDKEDGTSYVKIKTKLGHFCGWAFVNPDDEEIASSYAGCDYAYRRAIISYFEKKIKILNYKIEALNDLYKKLNNKDEYKFIKDTIKCYISERDMIKKDIRNIKIGIDEDIKIRPLIINELKKKQSN